MKKLIGLLATIACGLVLVFTAPEPAAAANTGVGQYCQLFAEGAGLTQGECASFVASLGPDLCKADANNNGIEDWADAGFKNRGDCTSEIQRLVRELIDQP